MCATLRGPTNATQRAPTSMRHWSDCYMVRNPKRLPRTHSYFVRASWIFRTKLLEFCLPRLQRKNSRLDFISEDTMGVGKRSAAEFFGTFWLVFGGCGSAVLAAAFPSLGIGFAG